MLRRNVAEVPDLGLARDEPSAPHVQTRPARRPIYHHEREPKLVVTTASPAARLRAALAIEPGGGGAVS
jgi:hypothetical protein